MLHAEFYTFFSENDTVHRQYNTYIEPPLLNGAKNSALLSYKQFSSTLFFSCTARNTFKTKEFIYRISFCIHVSRD